MINGHSFLLYNSPHGYIVHLDHLSAHNRTQQPTQQAASQPAPQPATQPAPQPAPQPVPQPAPQPAPQPTQHQGQGQQQGHPRTAPPQVRVGRPSTGSALPTLTPLATTTATATATATTLTSTVTRPGNIVQVDTSRPPPLPPLPRVSRNQQEQIQLHSAEGTQVVTFEQLQEEKAKKTPPSFLDFDVRAFLDTGV